MSGKSYDSVSANSFDDEQYNRKINAGEDVWAHLDNDNSYGAYD